MLLRWPLLLTGILFGLSFLPRVRQSEALTWSFWGVCGGLLAWQLVLALLRRGRPLEIHYIPVRAHYVQACVQLEVYAYWGWYWRPVYDQFVMIIAQLVFAYVFDMLLSWSRGDRWTVGFGQFPIILSINLFLWFRDDWYSLQFLMIAVGAVGKNLIRWRKGGRTTHIFNPSGLSLTVFSIILIATSSAGISWGQEIATTLTYPRHIYLEIFLLGLIVQFLFAVTLTTLSAAAVLCALNLIYTKVTGVYFFLDSNIPIAVFLGLHLLVTDPATSPRTELGRVIFGGLYGAGVFGLYGYLSWIEAPTFYDKLLCVPFLNLSIQAIDRVARSRYLRYLSLETAAPRLSARKRNLCYMGVWVALFTVMLTTGFVGPRHEGGRIAFWQDACRRGLRNGCQNLMTVLGNYCDEGRGAACNELALLLVEGGVTEPDPATAAYYFGRSCDLGHAPGCVNVAIQFLFHGQLRDGEDAVALAMARLAQACDEGDGQSCHLRGVAHATGRGVEQSTVKAIELYERSCDLGWTEGCRSLARMYYEGDGVRPDHARAAEAFDRACAGGDASSCAFLGFMCARGDGVPPDEVRAIALVEKACELGLQEACDWLRDNLP